MNRAPAQPVLNRFNPAQPGAQGMKVIATGLLVVMAAVFAAARALEPRYPSLGYVKAFAEAAMVGGLADWFAVTALFRHPLGLPIPHTAIIPRNKSRSSCAPVKTRKWTSAASRPSMERSFPATGGIDSHSRFSKTARDT